ncbi:MAG: hypothetical protein RL148_2613 [Planctomycetota bacterium]
MPNSRHHSSAPIAFVALLGMVLTSAATWATRSREEQRAREELMEAVQESTLLLRNELDQLQRRFERMQQFLANELVGPSQRAEFLRMASQARFEAPFIRWTGWQVTPVLRPTQQMEPTPDGGAIPMMAIQPAATPEQVVEPSALSSEFGTIEPSLRLAPRETPSAAPHRSDGNSLLLLRAAVVPAQGDQRPSTLTMGIGPDSLLVVARNLRVPRPLDLWLSTLDESGDRVTSSWSTAVDFERELNPTWQKQDFEWCGLKLRLESIQPGAPGHGMSATAITVMGLGLVGTMVATLLFSARRRERDLERQVKARTRELQLSMSELRSYGETVARELRDPLERIDDFCRALRTEWAETAPRSALLHVETIGANSREMAARIAMLRRMPELLTHGLELRAIDLDAMVRPLLAPHAEEQASRHIRIDLGPLGKVVADPLLLVEVFRNLIENAVRSTRGRNAPSITVERLDDARRAVFAIHDNGVGITEEQKARLFEPHMGRTTDPGEGTSGLGLALCKRILERHGGGIHATGEPGKGTSFVFWLPLESSAID